MEPSPHTQTNQTYYTSRKAALRLPLSLISTRARRRIQTIQQIRQTQHSSPSASPSASPGLVWEYNTPSPLIPTFQGRLGGGRGLLFHFLNFHHTSPPYGQNMVPPSPPSSTFPFSFPSAAPFESPFAACCEACCEACCAVCCSLLLFCMSQDEDEYLYY